jgi:hypothetical protein
VDRLQTDSFSPVLLVYPLSHSVFIGYQQGLDILVQNVGVMDEAQACTSVADLQ